MSSEDENEKSENEELTENVLKYQSQWKIYNIPKNLSTAIKNEGYSEKDYINILEVLSTIPNLKHKNINMIVLATKLYKIPSTSEEEKNVYIKSYIKSNNLGLKENEVKLAYTKVKKSLDAYLKLVTTTFENYSK
jgi:hypothetical protein